jgi:UDP-N-acetylmuramate--alanine ligase
MNGTYHLVGIGGVGMSALAQALLDAGAAVSGSDRLLDAGDATETLQCLRGQGVSLHAQDGGGVVAGMTALVVSTAIEKDNPDLLRAQALGIPVLHRAAALAQAVAGRRLIAVTGTCGKSTVTAMAGWMLAGCGLDPVVINGAPVVGWDAGGRIGATRKGAGAGAWAVVEADESDRSLMVFDPEHAVITNASADHFPLPETLALFDRFRARVRGTVVDGTADGETGPSGFALSSGGGRFEHEGVLFEVPVPGRHNVWNAWHAVRVARLTGASAIDLSRALASFRGVERRLQRVGELRGATVIDDYGHNPEKISAAWETLASAFPRICAVWRPHGYGPLRLMMDPLAGMFARVCRPQDQLLILPVYDMGGTADRSVRSEQLVERLQALGTRVRLVESLEEAEALLRAAAGPGTALVTLGARDPGLPRLAKRLYESRIDVPEYKECGKSFCRREGSEFRRLRGVAEDKQKRQ